MSYEYNLVGQLVKRAVEVGEEWDDNNLMNAAAERIARQEAEIVLLRLNLDELEKLLAKQE